jgi:isopenicillin-N epimerase
LEFAWTGTHDPTAFHAVPEAIKFIDSQLPGGWPEVRRQNHMLAVAARRLICDALDVAIPCPDEMIGSMASIPIPDAPARPKPRPPWFVDPLQDRLLKEYGIEVPIIPWPARPKRLLRISAHLYNSLPQYERLAAALQKIIR